MSEPAAAPVAAPTLKVRNFIDGDQLKRDLTYTLADLSAGFQTQAGMIVHYSTLAAKASRQVDNLKLLIEATEAVVIRKLRDAAGDTKVTEAQLGREVLLDPQVRTLKRLLNEAKEIEAIAKGAVEGFKHRKDMLVQEGAASREEMKGDLRMIAAGASATDLEAAKQRLLDRIQGGKAA